MPKGTSRRGQEVRQFILRQVSDHPRDLVPFTSAHFRISRQAVARYVKELIDKGILEAAGATRQRTYGLKLLEDRLFSLNLKGLEEDAVWREHIEQSVVHFPMNVRDMWNYGCTEMINNAIDHSGGTELMISLRRNAIKTNILIIDNGIGIFRKIAKVCNLEDERHAVLELAKGKLTTDPAHHTGEGIFFTSRIMDDFAIHSGGVSFSHTSPEPEDWILKIEQPAQGTAVFMGLDNDSQQTTRSVFEHFAADPNDYGFTKTVVPVRMAKQGAENLVSRSQAKRLLVRLDRFSTVILDFKDVESIGRAFADEIFRVFVQAHPNIFVIEVNANEQVTRTIKAARLTGATGARILDESPF